MEPPVTSPIRLGQPRRDAAQIQHVGGRLDVLDGLLDGGRLLPLAVFEVLPMRWTDLGPN